MPARRYVEIAGEQFNKSKFSKRWTEVVKSYEVGVELPSPDLDFILQSAQHLSRYRSVMDKGACKVKVVKKSFNGKRIKGLALITPNSGYEMWIGKQQVIRVIFPSTTIPNPSKINRRRALAAMRNIIEPQINDFKRKARGDGGVVKSSVSGKPIYGPYHVDHVYPFVRLAEEWCRDNAIDLEKISLSCRGVKCRFDSVEMSESWFDYHALNAEFQILAAEENLKKGSRYFGRGKQGLEDS